MTTHISLFMERFYKILPLLEDKDFTLLHLESKMVLGKLGMYDFHYEYATGFMLMLGKIIYATYTKVSFHLNFYFHSEIHHADHTPIG